MKRYSALLVCFAGLLGPGVWAQSIVNVITSDLFEPYGVAVDKDNNYFITDSSNNRILKFTPDTNVRTNYAGVPGFAGRGYVDGVGYQARFLNPQGIVAARGGFVVADAGNNRIRLVSPPDGTVSTLAGSIQGNLDGAGINAAFNSPAGLAVDKDGNIYIADLVNNAVRMLDPANVVTTVATNFNRPSALAIGGDGELYVADSGNHSIKVINRVVVPNVSTNYVVTLFAGSGSSFVSGSSDALLAQQATFNNPRGLLYVGGATGLLVSDSGNKILRRIFWNAGVKDYSVETVAGTVGSGLVNPVGLSRDANGDFLIADLGGNALRKLVVTQPQLPVKDPVIGTVVIIVDQQGNPSALLTPVTGGVWNNDVTVAILAEPGTATYYTLDGSDPSTSNGATPSSYQNGQPNLPSSLLNPIKPDVTVKAFSTAVGRKPSGIVAARFRFQVANPAIIGNNAASVIIEDITAGALIYYTTDGTDPTPASSLYTLGSKLNISNGANDVTLKVKAFKPGYDASRVVSQTFTAVNVQISSVGIPNDYTGGAGAFVIIPVEVNLTTNDVLKSLQFRVEIKPNGAAPLISDQLRVLPIGTNDFIGVTPPVVPLPLWNLEHLGGSIWPTAWEVYTNAVASGLAIGYFGKDVSFTDGTNTITYPGLTFAGSCTAAILAVPIPATAAEGLTYSISVLYPSGTADGGELPVQLRATDARTITVRNLPYVVGDTARSHWYNAGDFGNGNLNNNDVNNTFYAALGIRKPYAESDVFNAMDSYPEDRPGVRGGDGLIGYTDWTLTWYRSLRLASPYPSYPGDANNWLRVRSGGGWGVFTTNLNTSLLLPGRELSASSDSSGALWHPEASLSAAYVENVNPGDKVSVPVTLKVQPGYDVSGLQFLAVLVPQAGAPAVREPLSFVSADGMPTPMLTASILPGSVGCGWLPRNFKPALAGSASLGRVEFTVPATAAKGQSYVLRFGALQGVGDAAEGGLALRSFESLPGSVWVQTTVQKAPDVISDEWKTQFFGSLNSALADALADPDGDGKNNLQEFLAGTSPVKFRFHLLNAEWRSAMEKFRLKWFAAAGKKYVVESASDPVTGPWTPLSDAFTGGGDVLSFDAPKANLKALFYRVRQVQ